jgi:hypothetical protein
LKKLHYMGDLAIYQKLMAANPEAMTYHVLVDVPISLALKDVKGRPVTRLMHIVHADPNGFLQFADRPEDAPVIHFGGPWKIWPVEDQRFVLGRDEEFTTRIGTPGYGPGTLAIIQYHTLERDGHGGYRLENGKLAIADFVPMKSHPILQVQFPTKGGGTTAAHYVLEHRC